MADTEVKNSLPEGGGGGDESGPKSPESGESGSKPWERGETFRTKMLKQDARLKAGGTSRDVDSDVEGDGETVKVPKADVDKSSKTKWAQPGVGGDALWHGYSYYGEYADVSYCGIKHKGSKRASAPPREEQVCEKCATLCGFVRRRARRGKSPERQRGSRRLGNIVDRMEVAVDQIEQVLALIKEAQE